MWIVLNNAFVSIVEHKDSRDLLVVRGRFAGDVERFFGWPSGDARVRCTPDADYLYRAVVDRDLVSLALQRAVRRVTYPNFKDSIRLQWRSALAMRVWSLFWNAQEERRPPDLQSVDLPL